MRKKRGYSYFTAFVELAKYSLKACEVLNHTLNQFDSIDLDEQLKIMHEVEHSADKAKHDLFNRLAKEFLPPIDREDIIQLSEIIDDVTDFIEDVLINISIFNFKFIPQEFIEFSEVLENCCKALISSLIEFENHNKSRTLHESIIEVNRLEEQADSLYMNGVRNLFGTTIDPIKIMVWKEVYDSFEKCCDACEDAANFIENIVMKIS
ncbi:MAG TPA: DUF47 family protein [Clostridiales bacterium]|jgi:predicted phosphate transport protein (TIGR00153 family)|nr:DUF47 family protein [Clostridiales bacterium]